MPMPQHDGELIRRPAGLARQDQRIDHEDRHDAEMLDRADPGHHRGRALLGAVGERGRLLLRRCRRPAPLSSLPGGTIVPDDVLLRNAGRSPDG